jgi:hypothetical protein
MSIAHRLLGGLAGVKQTSSTTRMAKCPAHHDGTASLSTHDVDDRVLMHCFARTCYVRNVSAALLSVEPCLGEAARVGGVL